MSDADKLFALMLAIIAGGQHPNPLNAAKMLLAQFKKETNDHSA